jgi:hypothetical protein
MAYQKYTPFNFVALFLVIYGFFCGFSDNAMGFGYFAVLILFGFAFILLTVDFFIQLTIQRYIRIFILQFSIILVCILYFCWQEKTKILVIPDKLPSKYITIIYGVSGEKALPVAYWKWNYQIKIPENGILLTSSFIEDDFRKTKMKTYLGYELNSDNKNTKAKTDLGFGLVTKSELVCNNKKYKYCSWLIDDFCCAYSSKDIDTLQQKIQSYYCKGK